MLHLVFQLSGDASILERIDPGDAVVFFDNAVLRLLQNGNLANRLMPLLSNHRFYALADDLAIRGIAPEELIIGIEIIDYPKLVALTVEHPLIQTWS